MAATDIWGDWITQRRDGGQAVSRQRLFDRLSAVRDQVLAGAAISPGDVLVDIGCGDGLIGIAGLTSVGHNGRVIFVDISPRVLESCRNECQSRGLLDRASFVEANAAELTRLTDESADAITTRAVLIYLDNKSRAFEQFYRVLRGGGRISVWEPIGQYGEPEPPQFLLGYDLTATGEFGQRVRAVFYERQPPETDPMLGFDERDVLAWAEEAGFVQVTLRLEIQDRAPMPITNWGGFLDSSPNPMAPTWREAIAEALSTEEATVFLEQFRPIAEAGHGYSRRAGLHLIARKPGS